MDNEYVKRNKFIIKGVVLVGFFIALVILLSFIMGIVNERNDLYNVTVSDLGATWGKEQTIAGPVLVVPYQIKDRGVAEFYDQKSGQQVREERYVVDKLAVFLPSSLNGKINMTDEIRNRGIYKATVYTSDLQISGNFDGALIEEYFKNFPANLDVVPYYQGSYYGFGITDTSALTQVKTFLVNGVESKNMLVSGTSGLKGMAQFEKGLSAPAANITGVNKGAIPFDIGLIFRGSNRLSFLPFGEENHVSMASSWSNPSFEGFAAESKNISEDGFSADWSVSKLSRNYPQAFTVNDSISADLNETSFGVKFYDGVTHYRQVIRAVKYGYLFFALSFLVLFIFDVTNKWRTIHYVQYGIVGVSLVMFYLLLLAVSEHISFIPAYLLSTAAVVIPISLYTIAFMKDKKYGIAMFGILTGFYMILLSILKMENYALIMGTGLVMVTIYVLMYLTRHLKGDEKEIKKEKDL